MMNIAKYSLENTKVVYFFLAILLVGGVLSFDLLGKKEDSPFVIKTAVIITRYPGATPNEVEQLITEPIEREIQSMRRVHKIKSDSYYGMSKIQIELSPATPPEEMPQMWDELRRKVLNIQPSLPQGASTISVSDDFGDVFGIYYGLTAGEGFSYHDLREWGQKLKTQLVSVDGVQKVALYGEQTEVVNVFISMSKLANSGIDLNSLIQTIKSQNSLINTGEKRAGNLELKILADGTYKTLDDIRNQLIVTQAGQQVRLGDITTIEKGYMDPPSSLMRVNGKRAIGIGISTDPERDEVKTGDKEGAIEPVGGVDARGNRTRDSLPGERNCTGGKQWFPVESGGVRGDRDLYYFVGNGYPCRVIDRFLVDFLDRWYDADHAVYGSRVEPDVAASLYYSNGYAGG